MTEQREWKAFAEETNDPKLPFNTITDWEEVLAMSGVRPENRVSVRLVEDPEGELRGWIDKGADHPVMIQHKKIFPVQFAYGVDAEVERGNGEVVALRVEKIANLH
jgi:hypothetical protein